MSDKKLAIIASKGTLDWAYPPFILGTTAAALGYEVQVFCTFYGLKLLEKDLNLSMSSLGNTGMPMKMPFGPQWFKDINWKMPVLVQALPGFQGFMTAMMKKTMRDKGVASIEELRTLAIDAEIKLIACQMTVDLFGFSQDDLIDVDYGGAAMFFEFAGEADVCLFV